MDYLSQTEPLDLRLPKRDYGSTYSVGRTDCSGLDLSMSVESPHKIKSSTPSSFSGDKVGGCKRQTQRLRSIDGMTEEESDVAVTPDIFRSSVKFKSVFKPPEKVKKPDNNGLEKDQNYTATMHPKKRKYHERTDIDLTPVKEPKGTRKRLDSGIEMSSPITTAQSDSPTASIWKHPKKRRYKENESFFTSDMSIKKEEHSNHAEKVEDENRKSSLMTETRPSIPGVVSADGRSAGASSKIGRYQSPYDKFDDIVPLTVSFSGEASGLGGINARQKVNSDVRARMFDSGMQLSYEERRLAEMGKGFGQDAQIIMKKMPEGSNLRYREEKFPITTSSFGHESQLPLSRGSASNSSQVSKYAAPVQKVKDVKNKMKLSPDSIGERFEESKWSAIGRRCVQDSEVSHFGTNGNEVGLARKQHFESLEQKTQGCSLGNSTKQENIATNKQLPNNGQSGLSNFVSSSKSSISIGEMGDSTSATTKLTDKMKYPSWFKGMISCDLPVSVPCTGGGVETDIECHRSEPGDVVNTLLHQLACGICAKKTKGYFLMALHMIDCHDIYFAPKQLAGLCNVCGCQYPGEGVLEKHIMAHSGLKFIPIPEDKGNVSKKKRKVHRQKRKGTEKGPNQFEVDSLDEVIADILEYGDSLDKPGTGSEKKTVETCEAKNADEYHCSSEQQKSSQEKGAVDIERKKNVDSKHGKKKVGSKKKKKELNYKGRDFGPFVCDWEGCDQILKTRETLKVHMRRHTGEKPFGCHVCEYRGRQVASLHWHLSHVHGIGDKYQSSIRPRSRASTVSNESNSAVGKKKVKRRRCKSDCKSPVLNTSAQEDNEGKKPTVEPDSKCSSSAPVKMKKKRRKSRKVELDPRNPLALKIVETERPSM
jgi:hypothetical protein